MTPREIESLVARLPIHQREEARAKIQVFVAWGWTKINLYGDERPHIADLCGYKPGGDREFDFLPDTDNPKTED